MKIEEILVRWRALPPLVRASLAAMSAHNAWEARPLAWRDALACRSASPRVTRFLRNSSLRSPTRLTTKPQHSAMTTSMQALRKTSAEHA